MPTGKNPFANKLRRKLMPAIDDPRRQFLAKVRKDALGNLGEAGIVRIKKPKSRKPGVRTGRPVNPGQS